MKLSQYNANVNRNIQQAKIVPSGSIQAYGGDTRGLQGVIAAIGQVGEEYRRRWLKDQNDKVFDAVNEWNTMNESSLNDEKKGLFNTMQGKNAEGMEDEWINQESKFRQQILEKYHLDTEYAKAAFNKQIAPAITSTRNMINKQQRAQLEAYTGNQNTLDIQNTSNLISADPENAAGNIAALRERIRSRCAGMGMDEAATEASWNKTLNAMTTESLSAIGQEDYETGLNLCNAYDAYGADKNVTKKYRKLFSKAKIQKTSSDSFEVWIENHPDLKYKTPQEQLEAYRKENPFMPTGDNSALGRIGNTIAKELGWDPSLGYAVADFESGGGEAAPGNNYFGHKWDGEGEYQELNTRELDENGNEYYVKDKFKVYNSPEDSAEDYVKWIKDHCSQEEIANVKTTDDLAHLMKAHGYYTDTEENYAAGLRARQQNYGGGMSKEERQAQQEEADNAILAKIQKSNIEMAQRNKVKLEAMRKNITDMQVNGASAYEIQNYVESAGATDDELAHDGAYQNLRASVIPEKERAVGGSAAGGYRKASNDTVDMIIANIQNGDIRDQKELDTIISNTAGALSPAQYDRCVKALEDTLNGKDIEINVDKSYIENDMGYTISDSDWKVAKTLARRKAVQWSADNNNLEPDKDTMISILEDTIMNRGGIGTSEYSQVDLYNANIVQVVDDPDDSENYQIVYFKDGHTSRVYRGEVDRLLQSQNHITESDIRFTEEGGMM